MDYGEHELEGVIEELKKLGVKKIAPSHCSGDAAIRLFLKAWGKDFLDGGCGSIMTLP